MISFEIHPDAKDNFDRKAHEVLSSVTKIDRTETATSKESKFYIVDTISESDIIGDIRIELTDGLGNQIGMIFHANGDEYGIVREDYFKLVRLATEIQRTKQLQNIVSVDFIKEELFKWAKNSFLNRTTTSFIETMFEKLRHAIRRYEIWIPVPFTSIDEDFSLGKIHFRTITKEKISEWFNIPKEQINNEEQRKQLDELEEKIKKDLQGYAAGVYECEAEIGRAQELAYKCFAESLSILRLCSPANFTPRLICAAYEYGYKMIRASRYLAVGKDHFSISDAIFDKGIHWNIDKSVIGFISGGKYNELLNIENPNECQKKLLEALMIYSKHTIRYDVYDKLLYILAALESMLVRDSTEPIQQNLAERMAFLIADTADQRKNVIRNVKDIYAMRSRFVHHGEASYDDQDYASIEMFMYNSWIAFSAMVDKIHKFTTREQFVEALDHLKYV